MDLISFGNKFKEWNFSKFFWRETRDEPKPNWFYYWFPMFYDAWHLSTFLQVCLVSYAINPCLSIALIIGISLTFSAFYETLRKL